ncbi:two-component system sensor histidine kinase NtrB [Clostridium formicaceticum]|uniref:histidine kinase n=1 Tax=Clostridium formicaceticum TaxID=1497 RepID=A0AAC9RQ51_9CLOT|nr:ATP-binding protein [Clostridium formicaceticum]AOY74808.1 sensor histidine kinase [Clostridium formicaceticum]ARE89200.1 Sporulation kinase A [Clostridium formicaceticum]
MNQEKKWKFLIAFLILTITGFHYFTASYRWVLHDFFRRLYYLPIIWGAFQFRLKGGLIVSAVVVLLYAPHLVIYFGEINLEIINQFLEIAMFMIIGLITGYLVEKDYKRKKLLEHQIIKLTDLENYTHNILNSIDNGVIAFDCEGNITSANKQADIILGKEKDIKQFFQQQQLLKEITKVLEQENKIIRKEVNYFRDKDEEIYLDITLHPLKNISSSLQGVVAVIEDSTVMKKLEIQVRRGERLAATGQLASGIAHEIRNPLGIIKTISQTLQQEVIDKDFKEGLEIIEHEIDRANTVIKGLLDFSRPNKIQVKNFKLGSLLEELLKITKKFGEQQGVVIKLTVEETVEIEGDTDKLKQAFVNIILNGIQAMEEGGDLKIAVGSYNQWAIVTFRDEGKGIEKEVLDKIFNPFFTTKESGSGLGLSITHRIIEEHQGKIEVSSKLEEGTEVKVLLPLLQ